jgi:hypothetical protein
MVAVTAMAAALLVMVRPAQAHHLPESHCSSSGDICQSVAKVGGVRKLSITLAERYFGRYYLCVKDPMDRDTCIDFKIQRLQAGGFGDTVRWHRHFPDGAEGNYVVRWFRVPRFGPPTERVGRRLGFHTYKAAGGS